MAGKLGLTNEVKEMKLGKSFGKGENPCFHTFRYDFMPASLDTTKRASVDIGDGHQVTVTVPHIEGSGTEATVFKGSKKPYQKECVLIIDHATGEITLEKLSYNVQLKKTRAEGSSKIRPPGESVVSSQKRSPQPQHPSPHSSSMPCLNTLTKPSTTTNSHGAEILSSSSSSSSSSGDSSDNEEMVEVQGNGGFVESSPKRRDPPPMSHLSMPTSNHLSMPTSLTNLSMPNSLSSMPSMPKFNLLNDDLKLSESDSDN